MERPSHDDALAKILPLESAQRRAWLVGEMYLDQKLEDANAVGEGNVDTGRALREWLDRLWGNDQRSAVQAMRTQIEGGRA